MHDDFMQSELDLLVVDATARKPRRKANYGEAMQDQGQMNGDGLAAYGPYAGRCRLLSRPPPTQSAKASSQEK